MRQPNPAPSVEYTFQSGVTVHVTPLSAYWRQRLLQLAQRKLRDEKPVPPTVTTDFGIQTNEASSSYQESLARWNTHTFVLLILLQINMAVTVPLSDQEQQAAIDAAQQRHAEDADLFATMARDLDLDAAALPDTAWQMGLPYLTSLKQAYIWWVAALEDEVGIVELNKVIAGQTDNLEGQVQQIAESFRGDMARSEHLEAHPAHVTAPDGEPAF